MATPLTADRVLSAFKAAGLTVEEVGDWRNHNRNHRGPFGPVHGVMIHHTVSRGTAYSVELCYDGHSDLPGPLCHAVIDKAGVVHLVGHGRTNHAGKGDGRVLQAVRTESELPTDSRADTDGNTHFYGAELVNMGDGEDPWPPEQVEAAAQWAAALCRAHGWTAASVIAHKEWQPGKVDPTFDMDDFRARVSEILADSGSKPPTGTKPPQGGGAPAFPGRNAFGPGKSNEHILRLGQQLVKRGFGSHYRVGPSPEWGEADRLNTAAFQRAQGWSGDDADGFPGPETWRRLFA
ncbi:peptidoglycan-binding protein [Streptomyces sp. NBC_01233]|uniref:peptidoglycan-binding protein n=1 Tax=Streptomyces sp. NBC_01233 TaxID=2903787 RepID=UPI002E165BDC|nr:peptidoglycan-binding protein [Streptomyces sp. NBC_01233]